MNYKNLSLRELIEFGAEHPEYTLGDLLFSVLQPVALKNKQGSLNWLRTISDEQMYTFVEHAKELETVETPATEIEIITILKLL